nr:MAG: hypothetical protein [Microviridae sp.]
MAIASHSDWLQFLFSLIVSVASFIVGHKTGKDTCKPPDDKGMIL